jgi:hypothetical protein
VTIRYRLRFVVTLIAQSFTKASTCQEFCHSFLFVSLSGLNTEYIVTV